MLLRNFDLHNRRNITNFAALEALMAELVDATVSNTVGAIRAGSSPAQGTELEILTLRASNFFTTPS